MIERGRLMIIRIKKTKSGNCNCSNCGCIQEGRKLHPYTVWIKKEDERRGHNFPVCSEKCAKEFAAKSQQEEPFNRFNMNRNNF